ncbi:outer membrane protein domain-containing protein [Paramagnetospirillum caucaseum]|uniref:Outer membrane protein domain-containing protein n=1 Tax=Paramagnetospirillum caucaseum TaxID=1244869 RepID=M2ZS23_9PROT|nr:autotransporter outer membrane beta-barrel domain-containing protein [Paramagnetospirillum caucaseum]EME70137.1 outer membrane protein domain-containing protein [Paramagnetospirillum caucaseum]
MRFRILGIAAAAGAFVLGSSGAFAGGALQACTASGYSTTYSQCSSNTNKSSTQVTAVETLKATSTQTAGLIAQRIGSFTGASPKTASGPFRGGLSGGSKDLGVGVWLNGGYSNIQYNKTGSEFNGTVWTGMGGVDYKFTDALMVGLAAGYEDTQLKTTFNNGNLNASGWTIAPYALYKFTKNYSVDVSGGYSGLNYTIDRLDPLVATKITGKTDADRWFAAANLNGVWSEDAWRFSAKFGGLWANESKNAFNESNGVATSALSTKLGSVNLGGKVGYNLGFIEPYVGGTGRKWLGDADDKADFLAQAGTLLYIGELAVGTIEVSTPLGDSNLRQINVVTNIRFDF